MSSGRSIAIFEKTFVRPFSGTLRGVESFNLRLARDFAAAGWRVCVPADPSWIPSFETALADLPSGFRANFSAAPGRGSGPPVLSLVRAALRLRRFSRRAGKPFDWLLLANDANGLAFPARLALFSGSARKLAVFAHKLPYPYFLRTAARRASSVCCVSDAVAEGFRAAGMGSKTVVCYGVANAGIWFPAAGGKERPPSGGPVRFCVFGSLDSVWKGADTAIAAWRLLPERFRRANELHLLAYSDPPDFSAEPGVFAHGWRGQAAIPEFLRTMDVLVAPSRDPERLMETFSQCVVQGMLTGIPVVHTSIPVFAEKFDRGGGIAADSPEEFAAAMETLAADPARRRRLGAEARKIALERYVWDFPRFERLVFGGEGGPA